MLADCCPLLSLRLKSLPVSAATYQMLQEVHPEVHTRAHYRNAACTAHSGAVPREP